MRTNCFPWQRIQAFLGSFVFFWFVCGSFEFPERLTSYISIWSPICLGKDGTTISFLDLSAYYYLQTALSIRNSIREASSNSNSWNFIISILTADMGPSTKWSIFYPPVMAIFSSKVPKFDQVRRYLSLLFNFS